MYHPPIILISSWTSSLFAPLLPSFIKTASSQKRWKEFTICLHKNSPWQETWYFVLTNYRYISQYVSWSPGPGCTIPLSSKLLIFTFLQFVLSLYLYIFTHPISSHYDAQKSLFLPQEHNKWGRSLEQHASYHLMGKIIHMNFNWNIEIIKLGLDRSEI